MVKFLLVGRYKGVRGVGGNESGGLFRELVPNLGLFTHSLIVETHMVMGEKLRSQGRKEIFITISKP